MCIHHVFRWLAIVAIVSFGVLMAAAPMVPLHTPNYHCQLMAMWLGAQAESIRASLIQRGIYKVGDKELELEAIAFKYLRDYRFVSFYAIDDEKELESTRQETWFVMNSASRSAAVRIPREVAGSHGRLYYYKLNDYAWNAGAMEAVVNRQPFFREPEVEHRHAEFLRRTLGTTADKDFSIGAVVYGPWLVRDAAETHKSPTYYDLLFAQERFIPDVGIVKPVLPDVGVEGKSRESPSSPPTLYPPKDSKWFAAGKNPDGSDYPAGYYKNDKLVLRAEQPFPEQLKEPTKEPEKAVERRHDVVKFKFVDFPKTEAELLKATGADVAVKQIEAVVKNGVVFPSKLGAPNTRFEVDRGAIVAHGQSGVSYRNRFVWGFQIISGRFWKTFDVKDASRTRNIVNRIFEFDYDASEVIWNNPNGSQGYMLFDGKGNRVEFADPEIVKEEPGAYRNYIRTPESCHNCHDKGINVPKNVIESITTDIANRIDIKAREKDYQEILRDRLKGFFLTRLGRDIKHSQEIFEDYLKESTSYQSLEHGKHYRMALYKYRASVTADQAARERGLDKATFLDIARLSPNYDLNAAVKGVSIPRETWDNESYREHVLLEDAFKKKVGKR